MKFDSWREAFDYQQSLRTDDYNKMLIENIDVNSGIPEIDGVFATTDSEIVWLACVDCDDDPNADFTQYGVGADMKWYRMSVGFDGIVFYIAGDSFKAFDDMMNL